MWARLEDGALRFPYTLDNFRSDYPLVSPPRSFVEMSEENRLEYGVVQVNILPFPEEPVGKVAVLGTPELLEGQWAVGWVLRDKTEDEVLTEAARRAAERQAQLLPALERMAELVLDPATLPAEELTTIAPVFADWAPGVFYRTGRVLNFGGTLLKVVQAHTSQADWNPLALPALYTAFRPPGTVTPWRQPTGAQDAYAIGDEVSHPNAQDGGAVWLFKSKIAANTTIPGTDGTFHRWWEPVRKL